MTVSTLRDRLRGIIGSPTAGIAPEISGHPRSAAAMDETLGGAWREHSGGRSFVVQRRRSPGDAHGAFRVEDFARRIRHGATAAGILGASAAQAPFLFFDLETTGLSGGAGTQAFIVGCGWFDPAGGFVTEQHFLTDHLAERPMLQIVAEEMRRSGALVTFNGKSFDAPVLETRYLFHRLASPCAERPHVDVLHPARRFWGGVSDAGCSLVTLEQQVLGASRTGDVPGFEIPSRYFHFIRTGDARALAGVFEHNRLDLLSLAGLTSRLFELIEAGAAEAGDAREALALGRVYGRAGLDERAEDAYARAEAMSAATPWADRGSLGQAGGAARPRRVAAAHIRIEALRALALVARRQRRFDAAAARWRELLDVPGCPGSIAREAIQALAVHHEHRARDLATAKVFALKSLEFDPASAGGDAARHRLARIERKMVSERKPLFPSSSLQPSCGFPTSERRTSS